MHHHAPGPHYLRWRRSAHANMLEDVEDRGSGRAPRWTVADGHRIFSIALAGVSAEACLWLTQAPETSRWSLLQQYNIRSQHQVSHHEKN